MTGDAHPRAVLPGPREGLDARQFILPNVTPSLLTGRVRPKRLERAAGDLSEASPLREEIWVVEGGVLGPLARQRPPECALIGEGLAVIVQRDTLAMPRQGDVGRVPVHVAAGQHMSAIDRHPLRLVDVVA